MDQLAVINKLRILKIDMNCRKNRGVKMLPSVTIAHSQEIQSLKSSKSCESNYSELEKSLLEILHTIQDKAYKNVQTSSIIMKKYRIAQQFETQIRQFWKQIRQNITEFVQIDREIMKSYCEIKKAASSALQNTTSQNFAIGPIVIERQSNQARLSKNISSALRQMNKKKERFSAQIQSSLNMIKDYSVKVIEIITEKFVSPLNDLGHVEADKKQSTKEYIILQEYILNSALKPETIKKKTLNEDKDKENIILQSNRSSSLVKSYQYGTQKNGLDHLSKPPLSLSLGGESEWDDFSKSQQENQKGIKLKGKYLMVKSMNSVEPDTIISKILDLYNQYSFS